MLWFACWMLALSTYERGAAEPTDWMIPPGWMGIRGGRPRPRLGLTAQLPPIPMTRMMAKWDQWGRGCPARRRHCVPAWRCQDNVWFFAAFAVHRSRHGQPIFAYGNRCDRGWLPVVYDCSTFGIQRQPFAVWMVDSIGSFGVKRLKPQFSRHIAGVLGHCRKVFEEQVPFDDEFRIDDSRLYCVEMTEKAFRSQGLALSEPVCIGDWENLVQYPLTAMGIVHCSGMFVKNSITLDQQVYVPGNERQGIWASPLLETVYPYPTRVNPDKRAPPATHRRD